jgi:hypothetical protein
LVIVNKNVLELPPQHPVQSLRVFNIWVSAPAVDNEPLLKFPYRLLVILAPSTELSFREINILIPGKMTLEFPHHAVEGGTRLTSSGRIRT